MDAARAGNETRGAKEGISSWRHGVFFKGILDCARGEMCTTCTLEVRKSNAHAQSLYKSLGFKVKGTRTKIYQNPTDDAVLMEKIL